MRFQTLLKLKPLLDFANTKRVRRRNISGHTRENCSFTVYEATVRVRVLAVSCTGYVMTMVCYLRKAFEPVVQSTLQETQVTHDLLADSDMFIVVPRSC